MLQATRSVSGKVLWANLLLLFWLSLVPFATAWMGENHFDALPTAIYGGILLMSALSYTLLQMKLTKHSHGENRILEDAVGSDIKGKVSIAIYIAAIGLAFVHQNISHALYVLVAIIWFVPDSRIERRIGDNHHSNGDDGPKA